MGFGGWEKLAFGRGWVKIEGVRTSGEEIAAPRFVGTMDTWLRFAHPGSPKLMSNTFEGSINPGQFVDDKAGWQSILACRRTCM